MYLKYVKPKYKLLKVIFDVYFQCCSNLCNLYLVKILKPIILNFKENKHNINYFYTIVQMKFAWQILMKYKILATNKIVPSCNFPKLIERLKDNSIFTIKTNLNLKQINQKILSDLHFTFLLASQSEEKASIKIIHKRYCLVLIFRKKPILDRKRKLK